MPPASTGGLQQIVVFGLSLPAVTPYKEAMTLFLIVHVIISLLGILSGFVVAIGLVTNRTFNCSTAFFLATTVLTSVTGFILPATHFMPSHAVGIISMVVLVVALYARYTMHLAGAWRKTYVITALTALYLNVFVLVVQLFLKVPALHAMAPSGSEPPFVAAQAVVMILFVALAVVAAIRFKAPLVDPVPPI